MIIRAMVTIGLTVPVTAPKTLTCLYHDHGRHHDSCCLSHGHSATLGGGGLRPGPEAEAFPSGRTVIQAVSPVDGDGDGDSDRLQRWNLNAGSARPLAYSSVSSGSEPASASLRRQRAPQAGHRRLIVMIKPESEARSITETECESESSRRD
eukprot:2529676-Rhodomonas_salina.2